MVAAWQVVGAAAPHNSPMITIAFAPPASTTGRPVCASKAGAISSCPSGRASQVCMPYSFGPPARSATGERSEWTMPRPAVIRLTCPGRIVAKVPRLSRWSIAPSNSQVTVARLMCGCGRTSIAVPGASCAGPNWSTKMNGPTMVRPRVGSTRRTVNWPRSWLTGAMLVAMLMPLPPVPARGSPAHAPGCREYRPGRG